MFDDFDGGGGTVRHVTALPCSDLPGIGPDGDRRRTASDDRIVALPLPRASDKLLHNHNDSGAALIPCHSQRVAASIADNNRTPLLPTVAEMVRPAIVGKHFRIFRNHYLCDDCPNEWSDEMMVVGPSYCPCCDGRAEPYDTESLLDDVVEEA